MSKLNSKIIQPYCSIESFLMYLPLYLCKVHPLFISKPVLYCCTVHTCTCTCIYMYSRHVHVHVYTCTSDLGSNTHQSISNTNTNAQLRAK